MNLFFYTAFQKSERFRDSVKLHTSAADGKNNPEHDNNCKSDIPDICIDDGIYGDYSICEYLRHYLVFVVDDAYY